MVDSKHQKFYIFYTNFWASLVAQLVKNQPAMWETWVQSLDCKDPPGFQTSEVLYFLYIYLSIYKEYYFKKNNYLKAFTKP